MGQESCTNFWCAVCMFSSEGCLKKTKQGIQTIYISCAWQFFQQKCFAFAPPAACWGILEKATCRAKCHVQTNCKHLADRRMPPHKRTTQAWLHSKSQRSLDNVQVLGLLLESRNKRNCRCTVDARVFLRVHITVQKIKCKQATLNEPLMTKTKNELECTYRRCHLQKQGDYN